MAQVYQWRADVHFDRSPGSDSELSYGALTQSGTSWQTATAGPMNIGTRQYYYRDSNTKWKGKFQDALSSRALYTITQSWTASFDSGNVLTIRINTTINSAIRDDIRNPRNSQRTYYDTNTPGRYIIISAFGPFDDPLTRRTYTDKKVATAHTMFTDAGNTLPFTLPEQTISLTPGVTLKGNSIQIYNETMGTGSWDVIYIGATFYNPMPDEYRPGKVYNGVDDWLSHNRSDGASEVLTNTNWSVMSTIDGGTGTGNPPLIMDDNLDYHNMREIGTE